MLADNAVDNDDKGTGGATDLRAAATKERYNKTGDDGGVEALLGFDAGGDGKGNGQRQSDDADDEAGHQVLAKLLARIAFAQNGKEFGL